MRRLNGKKFIKNFFFIWMKVKLSRQIGDWWFLIPCKSKSGSMHYCCKALISSRDLAWYQCWNWTIRKKFGTQRMWKRIFSFSCNELQQSTPLHQVFAITATDPVEKSHSFRSKICIESLSIDPNKTLYLYWFWF